MKSCTHIHLHIYNYKSFHESFERVACYGSPVGVKLMGTMAFHRDVTLV